MMIEFCSLVMLKLMLMQDMLLNEFKQLVPHFTLTHKGCAAQHSGNGLVPFFRRPLLYIGCIRSTLHNVGIYLRRIFWQKFFSSKIPSWKNVTRSISSNDVL